MTDILETRLAFLANGYEPLPAIGKAVKLNGWTTVHLDADTVRQGAVANDVEIWVGDISGG